MPLEGPVDTSDLTSLLEAKGKTLSRMEAMLKDIENLALHNVDLWMRELVGRSVYSLKADIKRKSKSYDNKYDWSLQLEYIE